MIRSIPIGQNLNKLEVARRQLWTALALFMQDSDPVSVHTLACGGGEIAEAIVRKSGSAPFFSHVLKNEPDFKERSWKDLRNKYWNSFKHFDDRKGSPRNDDLLFEDFSDLKNDHVLFVSLYDLSRALPSIPLEVQVFQAWYYAMYPEKMDESFDAASYDAVFPSLARLERPSQKALLRAAVDRYRQDVDIMSDSRTDPRPIF